MKKTIFDLPGELLEDEIFSRVSMTSLRSLRSTCRKWNVLCKNRVLFGKAAEAKKQQFMMMDSRICLMNFDLRKNRPCIEQVKVLEHIEISKVFQCNGLLLCVLKDCSRLLVWNPYLGQTRWIEPRITFQSSDRFALGHDNNNHLNHKILRISDEPHPIGTKHVLGFELYDFTSGSWKVLDCTRHWEIWSHLRGVSLKGNAYFPAHKNIIEGRGTKIRRVAGFFLCFDFTTERFGPLLPLPFQSVHGGVFTSLSCVREDQLAVLYQHWEAQETVEISVTDKIGPNVVSWTKFLKLTIGFWIYPSSGTFFIDEEKKIAVVFVLESVKSAKACRYQTAHVIGQDGYFKSVRIREAPDLGKPFQDLHIYCCPLVCSSYLPCLVQLQNKQPTVLMERM